MDKKSFEAMLTDVETHFVTPKDILVDNELTRTQKIKLLEQWDYDMQLLLAASEENMPNPDSRNSGKVAECIADLRRVMAELGVAHDLEAAGPGKVSASAVETHRHTVSH